MKVLLEIGSVHFLASSAVSAAKVADLLGTMLPVDEQWHFPPGSGPSQRCIVCEQSKYSHKVTVESLSSVKQFASREEFDAWVKAQSVETVSAAPVEASPGSAPDGPPCSGTAFQGEAQL